MKPKIAKFTCKDCQDKLVYGKNWGADMKHNSYVCIPCVSARTGRSKRESKKRGIEYLGGKCFDCHGVFDPAVYDFHHVDPTTKEHEPKNLHSSKWETLRKELDKCVVLCANCHRLRHVNQQESGWKRKLNPRPRIAPGSQQKTRKPIKDILTGQVFESQAHAAKHYGVTPQCISFWVTGRTVPSTGIRIKYVNDKDLWRGRKSVAKQRKKRGIYIHSPSWVGKRGKLIHSGDRV